MNVLRLSAWQLLVGSIPLGLIAAFHERVSDISWSPKLFLGLEVLSVPGTAIATLLWFQVLNVGKLHRMNAFTFLTPLFALVIGAAFLGEVLELNELIGTAVIIMGLIVLNCKGDKNEARNTPKSHS